LFSIPSTSKRESKRLPSIQKEEELSTRSWKREIGKGEKLFFVKPSSKTQDPKKRALF